MSGINAFHAIAVAPMLGYIGYQSYQGNVLSTGFAVFLMIIALIVFAFHASKYIKKADTVSDTAHAPHTPNAGTGSITI